MLALVRAPAALAWLFAVLASCGGSRDSEVPIDPSRPREASVDVGELEIRGDGVDRFTTCPPPGELGQHWIPAPFAWSGAKTPDARAGAAASSVRGDDALVLRTGDRTPTEAAVEVTYRDFRSCYRKGLIHHPTQDGRVAIVLRLGPDGRVGRVEEYAACELAPESIRCMKDVAARLRFPPPSEGQDTITIPVTFTSRDGVRRTTPTTNDAYTAGAFVTFESARPALHACERDARARSGGVEAWGTFTLTLARDGRVEHTHVEPWTGASDLLVCAARALERLVFAPPDAGKGVVVGRLNFNPRQGTR
jgi:hypothetical protein